MNKIHFIIVIINILFLFNCYTKIITENNNNQYHLSESDRKVIQERIIKEFYLPITEDDYIVYARYEIGEGSSAHYAIIFKINFSGKKQFFVKEYSRKPKLINEKILTSVELEDIDQFFQFYKFQNFPLILPIGEANRQWPSMGTIIGLREKPDSDIYIIKADMTADRQFYPDGFVEFASELEKILRETY